jgi:hypothetical protein
MTYDYSVDVRRIPITEVEGKPLGRHIRHDSRSRQYAVQPTATAVQSVLHAFTGPVLDQGNLGSCTGNMVVNTLKAAPFTPTVPKTVSLDETLAVKVYSLGTTFDSDPANYPPTDTGSDGLSVGKAAKALGLISGYRWAFGIDAALLALMDGPIGIGIDWYAGFDNPTGPNALVAISGAVRGGHEVTVIGYDASSKTLRLVNSWGSGWGDGGFFTMSVDTLTALLKAGGDVVQFTPLTAPAPVPTPVPPTPMPTPTPPADADAALAAVVKPWLAKRPWCYKPVQKAVTAWLAAKGL